MNKNKWLYTEAEQPRKDNSLLEFIIDQARLQSESRPLDPTQPHDPHP